MSSFDDADRRAKYAVVPKRANEGQVVKLEPKKLKTQHETRTVLPEEKYLSGLEEIIQRDYFPELPKLRAQNEFLDAQRNNDIAKMRELQLQFKTTRRTERRTSPGKAQFEMTPLTAPSPAVFDPETPGPSKGAGYDPDEMMTPIPGANPEGDNEVKKKKSTVEGLSVDSYLYKFTSEDNASFEEVTAYTAKKHREKIQWLYDAAEKHNKEMVTQGNAITYNADEQLALRYDVEAGKAKPKALDNWNYTAHSHVLFHPEDAPLTESEKEAQKKKNQREINKTATRFPFNNKMAPSESSMARAAFSQAVQLAGKVDALGNELGVVKGKTLGLVATPAINPGVDDTPLMTWGEIDNTPFRLDAADVEVAPAAAPAFKIPAIPAREALAQTISETLGKRFHDKRRHAIRTLEKGHSTRRTPFSPSTLSPAAEKLKMKLGIKTGRTPSHMGASPLLRSPLVRTPGVPSSCTRSLSTPKGGSTSSSITDNLLAVSFPRGKTPTPSHGITIHKSANDDKRRPTAGDFF
ncbi:hypothetical protein PENTCL1PPCAC_11587 [Pristionchus entomophagus]|uniref:Uncharacterized protein n=1 Tax=Pristionchus entomophagus TaxID=358040 RepID=A0AAV5T1F3_9BILA|nr:hypothetical protein PENTCL1PPCAC_11587 [Pristionchus entomophagus]